MLPVWKFPTDPWPQRILVDESRFDWERLRPAMDAKGIVQLEMRWTNSTMSTAGDDGVIMVSAPHIVGSESIRARLLYHESAHLLDKLGYLTEAHRTQIRDLLGIAGRPWIEADWNASPGEWFADAFAHAYGPPLVENTSPFWVHPYANRDWAWDDTDRIDRLRAIVTPPVTVIPPTDIPEEATMVALTGRNWRLAPCLVAMVDEANRIGPKRNRKSDGSIGDPSHSARASDHNPSDGWVCAVDLTHAPASGFDAHARARMAVARRDPRIKYVISNGQIARSYAKPGLPAWTWTTYTGPNKHTLHAHFSVRNDPAARDDRSPWWPAAPPPPVKQEDDEMTPELEAKLNEMNMRLQALQQITGRTETEVGGITKSIKAHATMMRDSLAKLIRDPSA